jgi:hypothetical protein
MMVTRGHGGEDQEMGFTPEGYLEKGTHGGGEACREGEAIRGNSTPLCTEHEADFGNGLWNEPVENGCTFITNCHILANSRLTWINFGDKGQKTKARGLCTFSRGPPSDRFGRAVSQL